MFKTKSLFVVILSIFLFSFIGCFDDCAVQEMEEKNKATIKMIHAELVKGNVNIIDEVLSSDYVRHCQAMPPGLQELHGTEKFKLFLEDFVGSVSNYSDSIGPIMADGNMVAYVSTMKATNSGSMNGMPPTDKDFKVVNLVIHRFEDDKLVETWVTWDNLAVLSQLGLFPPPEQDTP